MATGILHAHIFFVTIFLVHYVVKLWLLQLNKTESLAKYTRATRIIEMIVSVCFLGTGIALFIVAKVPLTTILIVKLACVFASIPLAIIGFKKANKALALLAVVLIVMAYGLAEMNKNKMGQSAPSTAQGGKELYQQKCSKCHGDDGKAGVNGAKDLSVSMLSEGEKRSIIRNGKGLMSGFDTQSLSDPQLDSVVAYINTLKQ